MADVFIALVAMGKCLGDVHSVATQSAHWLLLPCNVQLEVRVAAHPGHLAELLVVAALDEILSFGNAGQHGRVHFLGHHHLFVDCQGRPRVAAHTFHVNSSLAEVPYSLIEDKKEQRDEQ